MLSVSYTATAAGNVSGVVLDENKLAMPGVVVQVDGTTVGTITDENGAYSLSGVGADSELHFSFIGYTTAKVAANKDVINVEMNVDAYKMDEVVVVGYGTQSKITVTGSVASIDNAELKTNPSSNVEGALAGKLPGLTVLQNSGQPGVEDFTIRLRGASSTNGQDPLILVDGVVRDNLSMLDANEIASVSILKDASSTAVYGVRGANGVILVTTRMGESEKPALSISAEAGFQSNTTDLHTTDSWKYAELTNEARNNDGYPDYYSDRQINLFKDGTNPLYPNTDWFDLMYKDFSLMQRYNANLSGRTKKVKYFVNLGMIAQDGSLEAESRDKLGYDPSFSLNRVNFRSNVDVKVNDWITAGVKLAAYLDDLNSPYRENVSLFINRLYAIPAVSPLFPDASWTDIPSNAFISSTDFNPYTAMNYKGYEKSDKNTFNSSVSLDFDLGKKVTKGLSAKMLVSYDAKSSSTLQGERLSSYNYFNFSVNELEDLDGNISDVYTYSSPEYIYDKINFEKSYSYTYGMNFQGLINYDRKFKKHNLSGVLVFQRDNSRGSGNTSIELLPYNYIGYAARAGYRYDDKYMFEVNLGYNGSEQFAEGNRFALFPAFSVGWVASNEKFLKDSKVIDMLKVRASYGKVGSDRLLGDRFLYLDNMMAANGGATVEGNGNVIKENLLGNPNLTWEVAYKQNYGIDVTMLDRRLSLSVDYFRENRENILIKQNSTPGAVGVPSTALPRINAGQIKNKGFEVEAMYSDRIGSDLLNSTCKCN